MSVSAVPLSSVSNSQRKPVPVTGSVPYRPSLEKPSAVPRTPAKLPANTLSCTPSWARPTSVGSKLHGEREIAIDEVEVLRIVDLSCR